MRKMISAERGSEINVALHIITKNFWEFYLEEPDENGNAFGFVMGIENELGYTNIAEIKPYAVSATSGSGLFDIAPAAGFQWAGGME